MSERKPKGPKLNPVRERKLSTEKKSTAKAAGLKSVFVMKPGELLMTSFGRGNDAVLEKRVQNGAFSSLAQKPAFDARPRPVGHFTIDGRVKDACADDPEHLNGECPGRPGDLVFTRAALEQRFFGRTFEDNIHIQLIHNILDVEKILTLHINNIIYQLNNMMRNDGEDVDDLLGYLSEYKSHADLMNSTKDKADGIRQMFFKLCRARQLLYFGLEVEKEESPDPKKRKKPDPNTIKLSEAEFFDLMLILSKLRQTLAHGKADGDVFQTGPEPEKPAAAADFESATMEEALARFQAKFAQKKQAPKKQPKAPEQPACAPVLTRLYGERMEALNRDFLTRAKTNLILLFRAFGVLGLEEKKEYVRDYYDFTVQKSYKNMGFSIKLLREHMTADIEEAWVLRDQKYDSVRGKLYPFLDFALFMHYRKRPEQTAGLVNSLRASFTEEDKDRIYRDEAARTWPEIRELVLRHILPEMSGDFIARIGQGGPDADVTPDMLAGVQIGADAYSFSKLVYAMTLFLDGKEINDLLTTLVHKFESIAAFQEVLKAEQLPWEVDKRYSIFNRCPETSAQLRIINSVARMSKESAKAKMVMFEEAVQVLGCRMSQSEMEAFLNDMTQPAKQGGDRQKLGVRNFIANNVIESSRFRYIVRYGNPKKVKALAENLTLVKFVLKDIPDTQIERYYNACTGKEVPYGDGMRDYLAEAIARLSFSDLTDVRQNDREANRQQQEEKRQKQAIVRLYLTVLYLIVKNLVYINSRYFLAFHCVERDRLLLAPKKWKNQEEAKKLGLSLFAREFLAEHPQRPRVRRYLEQNFANSDDWAIQTFRNKVEHLDAVRNADLYLDDLRGFKSWFELYHYIMQRRIMAQFEFDSHMESSKIPGTMVITREQLNPRTLAYFALVEKYRTCCLDFIKALNVPFAYNLPRYKNLSIDGLFDKNRPGEKQCGKAERLRPDGGEEA